MIIGTTVKSIHETCGYVTIELADEDGARTVRITLKADDPDVEYFRFRANLVVEINSIPDTRSSVLRALK